MKLISSLFLALIALPTFAEQVKISRGVNTGSGKTAKIACQEMLLYAKDNATKDCATLDGKILSWELFVKLNENQNSCSVTVIATCDAPL